MLAVGVDGGWCERGCSARVTKKHVCCVVFLLQCVCCNRFVVFRLGWGAVVAVHMYEDCINIRA